MTTNEIYLLTAFVCSVCDGEIAQEEVGLVKSLANGSKLFDGLDVEGKLNSYVKRINDEGMAFINAYLNAICAADLSATEQLNIVEVAIKMIEADKKIEYSEIKFFKKLRSALTITDEQILAKMPEIEDFLLPDINVPDYDFSQPQSFSEISFSSLDKAE